MRFLLATIGSAGDVHPYLAIASELRSRGHEVMVLTNPYFASRVRAAGAEFAALGTTEEYEEAIRDPRLVDPSKGPSFVIQTLVLANAREHFLTARRVIREFKPDAALRHLISFAPGWALQQEGVPTANVALTPMFWLSPEDPCAIWHWSPGSMPVWVWRMLLGLGKWRAWWMFDGAINRARGECHMPRIKEAFFREILGDGVRLGLWSPAFRGVTAGDPAGSRICGFCVYDQHKELERLGPLEAFLAAGPAPVVFTLGTSVVHHAGAFYEMAHRVSEALGVRAVLLLGPEAEVPQGDERVHCAAYAPYSWLLPRARAVVHHGGIGTTGQCLASGVPQLVIPHANDEFDNAARVVRLGAGLSMRARGMSDVGLRRALGRLLADEGIARAAQGIARAMAKDRGPVVAADELEVLARAGPGR